MRQKDVEAREEYEKQKKEGEKKSIVAGKQSQKEEAFRIGGHALRAVLMQLLVGLMQEIMTKLIKWFKSAKKGLNTLLDSLEEAIRSFVGKLKTHLINAGNTVFSTVMTAIVGPVLNTIKRAWALFHQGFKALSDAIVYLRSPESRGKPIGRLLCEVGKIIVAGLTGVGAMLLSEVVETGLSGIPIFAFEIPLLGSLANILGIFFGSVVAGIIGAIAINFIERKIEKDLKAENVGTQIGKGNEILGLQRKVQILNEEKLEFKKNEMVSNMQNRYTEVGKCMKKSAENIEENCALDTSIQDGNDANEKMIAELGGW